MFPAIADTIALLQEKSPIPLQEIRVADLVIGIFFTGVKLSTGDAGVAYSHWGGPRGSLLSHLGCPNATGRRFRGESGF